ncbi:hypothetical protein FHX57_001998 [Paraburkholderia tropica]|uniref:hypothetical protein n=1 Tax=Paraburkholderia tropica TaxID=92647 RepID=UPI00161A55F9|nr:hypothetical protein [Paraburkholderia tropica]MBB2999667.1 hypothetical protein [Paraburkholderia tropica]
MQDRVCGYAGPQLYSGENAQAIGKQQAMANQLNYATAARLGATTVMGYLDVAHEGLIGLGEAIAQLESRLSSAVILDGGCVGGTSHPTADSNDPPAVASARAVATKIEMLTSVVNSLSARVVL